jgi:hypothetical protein
MTSFFDKLIELETFGTSRDEKAVAFMLAVNESYAHHFANCAEYQKFCLRRGFTKDSVFRSPDELPVMPVQAFKEYGEFLVSSINGTKKNLLLQSSATSGRPSSVSIDKATARRQVQTMSRSLIHFVGSKRRPFLVFDVDPKVASPGVIGARMAATMGFLNFAKSPIYLLKEAVSGGLELDREAFKSAISQVSENDIAPIIFGFTYVFYEAVLEQFEPGDLDILGSGALLLHIGGWKKLESRRISKQDFNIKTHKLLGIISSNIIDVYGFTEQMGIIYPSVSLSDKTVPVFAEVLVRDPVTMEVLPQGQEGVLQFVSPMPFSYPGLSVMTDDLGVITGYNNDPQQGPCGTRFKITGRSKNAEVRGCGDIMSSYVEVQAQSRGQEPEISRPKLLFQGVGTVSDSTFLSDDMSSRLPEIADLGELRDELLASRLKLDKYTVDELIGFMSEVSKLWLDDAGLSRFKQHGLSFLQNWLNSANLRSMADQALLGRRGTLDGFCVDPDQPYRSMRSVPRGVVVHWLAGNVPLLGMLGLAQSIITKNANILKAPGSNSGVMPLLLNHMAKTDIRLSSGRVVYGRDICDSIAVIYYPRTDNASAVELSKMADLRLAWGGREAIESVLQLPKAHTTEDVIFGPKLSYMAIGREALGKETNIRKLIKRVATDCSVFDQYACASPHTIFVERGGDLSAKEFAEMLAFEMDRASIRLPKEPTDAGTAGNITSARMLYEFTADLWTSKDTTWSVLFDEQGASGLVKPTYSRVITVRAIDDIMGAADFAHGDIQTISLAMTSDRKIIFANKAALLGASRFPEIGRMTHFDSPWDGLMLMERLVRKVSLGGPGV